MVRKKLRPVSAMPPQPNDAVQNYSISRPGNRSVGFFDTKSTVGIHKTYCPPILCKKKSLGNRIYASRKYTIMNMCRVHRYISEYKNYTQGHYVQNFLNITSETFSCNLTSLAMFACNPWLNGCDKTYLLENVWNWNWALRPSIHQMRNTRVYFLTIFYNCLLKNMLYYIHDNITFDYWTFLYICNKTKRRRSDSVLWQTPIHQQNFFLNLSFFVLLVYILFLVADIAVRTKNLTLTLVLLLKKKLNLGHDFWTKRYIQVTKVGVQVLIHRQL